MSRLRRVLDTSKMVAGQGPQRRAQVQSQPTDDVARRFQEMVVTRSDREGPAPQSTERAEIDRDRSEEVLDLGPEALVSVAAPPVRDDEAQVLVDEPEAAEPVAAAQPTASVAPAPPPALPTESVASPPARPAPGASPPPAESAMSPWKPLSASALDAARSHDSAPALRDRPVPPPPVLAAAVEPSPDPGAGQGVRAWLASKGATSAGESAPTVDAAALSSADAPLTGSDGSLPVGLAGAPAVKWADVLRKGAQRVQATATPGVKPAAGAPAPSGDVHAQLMDLITGKASKPTEVAEEPQPETPSQTDRPAGAPREESLLQALDKAMAAAREPAAQAGSATRSATAARPGAPAQPAFLAPAPEQPPGAMRIRVPTANGETVRGSLHVDPDTRAVRLTLAVQEGETARSMSTAHEMLRARLADEGYQLNSYVVRHDGKSIVRLDSEQLGQGGTAAHGGAEGGPAGDPNSQRSDRDNPHGPLEPPEVPELTDDPVLAGWFV